MRIEAKKLRYGCEFFASLYAVDTPRVATDTGAGLHQSANGLGTGLTTLEERLRLIFGDAAQLRLLPNSPRGTIAEIDMPAHP